MRKTEITTEMTAKITLDVNKNAVDVEGLNEAIANFLAKLPENVCRITLTETCENPYAFELQCEALDDFAEVYDDFAEVYNDFIDFIDDLSSPEYDFMVTEGVDENGYEYITCEIQRPWVKDNIIYVDLIHTIYGIGHAVTTVSEDGSPFSDNVFYVIDDSGEKVYKPEIAREMTQEDLLNLQEEFISYYGDRMFEAYRMLYADEENEIDCDCQGCDDHMDVGCHKCPHAVY